MRVRVEISPKEGIADPEGATIARALRDLGYREVQEARTGRAILLDLAEGEPERAVRRVEEMCERLLANPVMEEYRVRVEP